MKKETLVFETVAEFKAFLSQVKYMPTDANRKINDFNKTDIKLSVLEIGIKRAINVVYTNVFNKDNSFDYYFLDGQHLSRVILEIADERLTGHFVVLIDEILSYSQIIFEISKLNSIGRDRTLLEYLRSWVYEERKSYVFLAELMAENKGYSVNSLVECLTGKKCTRNEDFKLGKLNCTPKQKAHAKKLIALHQKLMKTGLRYTSNSFSALVRFNIDHPEVPFDKIYRKVKKATADFKDIKGRDLFYTTLKLNCGNNDTE
jgi:hypothetical protein